MRSFHGQWLAGSNALEHFLRFRQEGFNDFISRLQAHAGWRRRLTRAVPSALIRLTLAGLALREAGPLHWLHHEEHDRIAAFFDSPGECARISGWASFDLVHPPEVAVRLDHGYDESKPRTEFAIEDMLAAAKIRGGTCLSADMIRGDLRTSLSWRCAFGHAFKATPTLVLLVGHWCPCCLPAPWNHGAEARRNPFLAQVWYNTHRPAEQNRYECGLR